MGGYLCRSDADGGPRLHYTVRLWYLIYKMAVLYFFWASGPERNDVADIDGVSAVHVSSNGIQDDILTEGCLKRTCASLRCTTTHFVALIIFRLI
jgi:hypothetical protein